jgi:hypothetical protein
LVDAALARRELLHQFAHERQAKVSRGEPQMDRQEHVRQDPAPTGSGVGAI